MNFPAFFHVYFLLEDPLTYIMTCSPLATLYRVNGNYCTFSTTVYVEIIVSFHVTKFTCLQNEFLGECRVSKVSCLLNALNGMSRDQHCFTDII